MITWFIVVSDRGKRRLMVKNLWVFSPSLSAGSCWAMSSLCFGSCPDVSHEVDLLYECRGSAAKVTANGSYRFTLYLLLPDVGSVLGVSFNKKWWETLVGFGFLSPPRSTKSQKWASLTLASHLLCACLHSLILHLDVLPHLCDILPKELLTFLLISLSQPF